MEPVRKTPPGSEIQLIRLDSVRKEFGSNLVFEGVDFDVLPGEIHALCGENGAGKSTCLGLLYGLHKPDGGAIHRDGKPVQIENLAHAQALGVGCVFQELSLAGWVSVAENIFAGRAPSRFGVVDWPELRRRARALLSEFGLEVDVSRPVDSLPISSRQIVAIAKALSLNSRALLLDEPTSALAPDEVDSLFEVLRGLTRRAIGIVYVSHHMPEIFRVTDRITVLRDGRTISTLPTGETSPQEVGGAMIGGAHPGEVERRRGAGGREVLAVGGLSLPGAFVDVSFSIRSGVILGLAGLMGARRSEIVRAIAGLLHGATGEIRLSGKPQRFRSLRDAMRAGVDVGAKFQIHTELLRRAAEGTAIILVSSDFPELVSLCTRIVVFDEGRVMGDIAAADAIEERLLQMAAGQTVPCPHLAAHDPETNHDHDA